MNTRVEEVSCWPNSVIYWISCLALVVVGVVFRYEIELFECDCVEDTIFLYQTNVNFAHHETLINFSKCGFILISNKSGCTINI